MKTFDPKEISTGALHQLLLGAVSPRPIAFASTVDSEGRPNLAPFSFFNVFSANPPILIFSPARRGRDNTTKHTYENVKRVPEVVINIVDFALVQQCSLASTEYPEGVNEFEKSGLTALPSETIRPFRVGEAPVQMECKVNQVIELGTEGGAGNLVICELLKMHVNPRILDANDRIVPQLLDAVARCGGDWYARISGDALFEVEKPLAKIGVGVDAMPADIRNSRVLTGNDLGKLGNVEHLPDETEVNEYKLLELSDIFIEWEDRPEELETELHKHARRLLADNRTLEAWKTLLAFNN